MPDDPIQDTGADADDVELSESPEESASPESQPDPNSALMNALIRGETATLVSTSKPGDEDDDEADGESAPGASASGDVKPSETQTQPTLGRRAARAEIDRLTAENARLQQAYDAANPPPPDATEETRKAILAAEERFRRLTVKPDTDLDWTQDDYDWIQAEKTRRAVAPELRQHYDTVLDADRATLRQTLDAERASFRAWVEKDLASAADLPGVDLTALKACPTFADRDRMVFAAGRATVDADNQRLRSENDDLRRQLLGTARAPLSGGQPSAGPTYDEGSFMNSLIRRGGRFPAA